MCPLTQGGVLAQVSWLIKWFPSPAVTENSTHTHTELSPAGVYLVLVRGGCLPSRALLRGVYCRLWAQPRPRVGTAGSRPSTTWRSGNQGE